MTQNNNLQPFDFEGNKVRALADGDEVMFVASDIAKLLGYRDAANLTRNLDGDERGTHEVSTPSGTQNMTVLTESGLYRAILNRENAYVKEPEAQAFVKRFQRWVTHEVLPSIRRTGGYVPTTETDDEKTVLAKAALIAQKTMAEQSRLIESQRAELDRQKPLALLGEAFVGTDGTMSVTQAARHFQTIDRKMTRDMVYGILRGAGYVETRSNAPTCKGIKPGYLVQRRAFKHDGTLTRPYARFTTKGLNWFINRFVYPNTQPRLEGMS